MAIWPATTACAGSPTPSAGIRNALPIPVARFGGENFAVILAETSIGGALMVAEKIRHGIGELGIPHVSSPFGQVTLSIGIASAAPGFDNPPDDLILAANKALYRAKQEGRDRICRFDAA